MIRLCANLLKQKVALISQQISPNVSIPYYILMHMHTEENQKKRKQLVNMLISLEFCSSHMLLDIKKA